MTFSESRLLPPLLALLAACGGSGGGSGAPSSAVPVTVAPSSPGPNVLAVSVDGVHCSAGSYLNKPCVSVTLCVPGTRDCQVVDDLLLDTGSTGLRVFAKVLALPLPHLTVSGTPVAECITYLDGSAQWGPVVKASVVLGGEPAVDVPIQLIDSTYATPPGACSAPDTGPAQAGFNGILGVGTFLEDCGVACTQTANGIYFACGASCAQTALPTSSQLRNPVAALPVDNNGVQVRLPAVAATGAGSAEGELILGIGTRGNNAPPATVQAYPLDVSGEFRTKLGGTVLAAFADTGSNGLFFPAPSASGLVACPTATGWYCPSGTVSLAATNAGAGGTPSAGLTFRVSSAEALGAAIGVAPQVAGPLPSTGAFDWGLPFHLGRDVYLGLEGRSSPLGAGPLVAY